VTFPLVAFGGKEYSFRIASIWSSIAKWMLLMKGLLRREACMKLLDAAAFGIKSRRYWNLVEYLKIGKKWSLKTNSARLEMRKERTIRIYSRSSRRCCWVQILLGEEI
jgi:hypothetical protein